MSKNLRLCLSVILLAVVLAVPGRAFAERATEGLGQWLQEFGVFAGYLTGDLDEQDDLQAAPVGMRFGFDLKPFTKKFGFEPKGLLEIVYEMHIGAIFAPKSNVEFAFPFFFKYAYPLTEKLYPFVEVGTGPYYMTLGTQEQSTKFNFVSAGGAGLMYFIREDLAVNAEFRYRHVSNSGIKQPNSGINAQAYLVGVSYFF
jgi:hypothetical protein